MEIGKEIIEIKDKCLKLWWDCMQMHFVALMELTKKDDSKSNAILKIFSFEEEGLAPSHTNQTVAASSNICSVINKNSIEVEFPSILLKYERGCATSTSTGFPFLVKISLDYKLLMIQFSESLLRVIPLPQDEDSKPNRSDIIHGKHWSLDLSIDINPLIIESSSIKSKTLNIALLNKPSGKIIEGSIIWSNHGGKSQDLIVVTTSALLCYKISLKRRKMSLSHHLRHPSHFPVATGTRFDPETRCLVVLCKYPSSVNKEVICVKAYVLSSDSIEKQHQLHQKSRPFPRLELPPPTNFPIFTLDQKEKKKNGRSTKREIFLMNIQGNPYLVDIFIGEKSSLGTYLLKVQELCYRKSIISILNALPFVNDIEKGISLSVIDNILFFSTSTHTLLLDACSSSSFIISKMIEVPSKMDIIFLGQRYLFLKQRRDDSSVYGNLYNLHLNLEKIGKLFQDVASRLSFLLQREVPYYSKAHFLVLQDFDRFIECQRSNDELSLAKTCRIWNHQVVRYYKQDLFEMDCENTMPLIAQCALLHTSTGNVTVEKEKHTDKSFNDTDSSFSLQIKILEKVLLTQAKNAVKNGDNIKLGAVRIVTTGMISELTTRSFPICPSFYCLAIALLWRAGHDKEVLATVQMISEQLMKNTPGVSLLAEMIIEITHQLPLGCQAESFNDSPLSNKRNEEQKDLVDEVFRCVSAFVSPQKNARRLLKKGQLREAMGLLTMVRQREVEKMEHNITMIKDLSFSTTEGDVSLKGHDFFTAALSVLKEATKMTNANRCRLFHSLYHFLQIWDPTALKLQYSEEEIEKNGHVLVQNETPIAPFTHDGEYAFLDDLFGLFHKK